MNHIRCAIPDTEIKKGNNKKIIQFDGEEVKDISSFYTALVNELEFPEYFGENLDALYDMLTDLQWLNFKCFVIVITNFNAFLSEEDFETKAEVMAVLDDAIQAWIEDVNDEESWDSKKLSVWLLGEPVTLQKEMHACSSYLETSEEE